VDFTRLKRGCDQLITWHAPRTHAGRSAEFLKFSEPQYGRVCKSPVNTQNQPTKRKVLHEVPTQAWSYNASSCGWRGIPSLRYNGSWERTFPKKSNSAGFQKAQRPFFEVNASVETICMKAKIILASIGIILVCVLLALWKPVPPAPAPSPAIVTVSSSAANRQEPPDGETVEQTSFPVRPREVQPDLENTPAALLARISEALASTDSNHQAIVLTNLLAALVRADPQAAAHFAETNQLGDTHDLILNRVAQFWAAQDPDAALAWAAQLSNPNERNATLASALLQYGQSDPEKALAALGQYNLADETGALRGNLAQAWAEKDWVAALTWVQAHPASVLQQDQILEKLALVLAKTSPAEAADFVVANISPGFTQNEAAISVLHQWGLQDLAAARAWLEQFPQGDLRQRGELELNGIEAHTTIANPGQ
jgi:hypothetical protein